MWREIVSVVGNAFSFERRVCKNTRDIELLEDEVRKQNGRLERLSSELQRLRDEFQTFKREEASEREKLLLRLQLMLERMEHRLPPSNNPPPSLL